jgi:hypothetical protein
MPAGILYPYPWLSLLHLQRVLHAKQVWAPSASEGANYIYILRNLASKSAIFGRTRFMYLPQSWAMGQIILLPLRRKACCRFFQPKKLLLRCTHVLVGRISLMPRIFHGLYWTMIFNCTVFVASNGRQMQKVKFTLKQVTKAQRWSTGTALLYL